MSVISSFENPSDKQQAQKDVIRRLIGRRADYYKRRKSWAESARRLLEKQWSGCMLLGHTQEVVAMRDARE